MFKPNEAIVTANFLPGPVELSAGVRAALASRPISHRSPKFRSLYDRVRDRLCILAGADRCALMLGSGTLANEAIAAQLKIDGGTGTIINRGEFGARLVDHAYRQGLSFHVRNTLGDEPIDWIWAVHCETSTGELADLERLKRQAKERGARLCLDCVSSIGAVELDLEGVYLAAASSGKALRAPAGIAIVFVGPGFSSLWSAPRYIDLGAYLDGPPFTFPSQLLAALDAALDEPLDWLETLETATKIRRRLRELGFRVDDRAAPHITTIELPSRINSIQLGDYLERNDVLISYRSGYLVRRNAIQICLMSPIAERQLAKLFVLLTDAIAKVDDRATLPQAHRASA